MFLSWGAHCVHPKFGLVQRFGSEEPSGIYDSLACLRRFGEIGHAIKHAFESGQQA